MFFSCYFDTLTLVYIVLAFILRYFIVNKWLKFNIINTIIDCIYFGVINSLWIVITWSSCPVLSLGNVLDILLQNSTAFLELIVVILGIVILLIRKLIFTNIYSSKITFLKEFSVLILPRWIITFVPKLIFLFL